MTGSKTGMVSRLHGEKSYILGVHCMAHRLELVFIVVMKTNNRYRKVEDLLTGLFTFYHRSPLNRATLKKSFSMLGMKPDAHQSRWYKVGLSPFESPGPFP